MPDSATDIERQIEYYLRKYELAPHSRAFAPLADLYRKVGRVEEALEILAAGLVEHPQYVSALVIRGRCHLDAGQRDAAGKAFQRVLELDPENLVALKQLAGLAESAGDPDRALTLLERVVELDPTDEASAARLDALRAGPGARPAEPGAGGDGAIAGVAGQGLTAMPVDPSVRLQDEPQSSPEPDSTATPEFESKATPVAESTATPESESTATPEPESAASPEPESTGRTEPSAGAESAKSEAVAPGESESRVEPEPEPTASVEGAAASESPLAAEPAALEPSPAPAAEAAGTVPEEPRPRQDGDADDRQAFITKTLAEIYLAQGYRDKALHVLRQILARHPERADVRAKLAELEAEPAPAAPAPSPRGAGPENPSASRRHFEAWLQRVAPPDDSK